jgi:fructose-specific phosphotransferase system IIC component
MGLRGTKLTGSIIYTLVNHFPLDTLIPFVSSKPVRLTTSSQVGNKVFGCVVCRFHVATRKAKLG